MTEMVIPAIESARARSTRRSRVDPQHLAVINSKTSKRLTIWNGRDTMFTLGDALAKLEKLKCLGRGEHAEIKIGIMQFPNGQTTALVTVIGALREAGWAISLRMARQFTARDRLGKRHTFNIEKLCGATSDVDGNLQLNDSTFLDDVKLEPTSLNCELTLTQEDILHLAISFLNAEDRCYRSVDDKLLPGCRVLDYAAVAALGRETRLMLKRFERYVATQKRDLSRQTIATALARAGLRRPRSGPRAR